MDKLLRLPEVAEMTGLPENTLRFWRHQGTGPKSARLGRRIVYRERDVTDWIDQQFITLASTNGQSGPTRARFRVAEWPGADAHGEPLSIGHSAHIDSAKTRRTRGASEEPRSAPPTATTRIGPGLDPDGRPSHADRMLERHPAPTPTPAEGPPVG